MHLTKNKPKAAKRSKIVNTREKYCSCKNKALGLDNFTWSIHRTQKMSMKWLCNHRWRKKDTEKVANKMSSILYFSSWWQSNTRATYTFQLKVSSSRQLSPTLFHKFKLKPFIKNIKANQLSHICKQNLTITKWTATCVITYVTP